MVQVAGIHTIRHPEYSLAVKDWHKWRYAFEGGSGFMDTYLQKYSAREDKADFDTRKSVSYSPSFAKSAIREIGNSIYQRMTDIRRTGGSVSYQRAVLGQDGGVDKLGSTMNYFMGQEVLFDLLVMEKVGVFVDMPPLSGDTLVDVQNKRPYIYTFDTEDICSWCYDQSDRVNEFSSILLRETVDEIDEDTGLPSGNVCRYRHMFLRDGIVWVKFYDHEGVPTQYDIYDPGIEIPLKINRIPFYCFRIKESLMTDIADIQIALLNLASADMSYALKSNYPFYTEQYDVRANNPYLRSAVLGEAEGQAATAAVAGNEEIEVGVAQGRRYPMGLERPQFIHPSSEPLKASMAKQEQLKQEIRQLCHLAVSNLQSRSTSAESKGMDERGLEAGLSAIGLILEAGERQIASFWAMYENSEVATVKYPEKYELKSAEDRRNDAKQLTEIKNSIPSTTFKREMSKEIVRIVLGPSANNDSLEKIDSEINSAKSFDTDCENVAKDVEMGLVGLEYASKIRGYPDGQVALAAEDHAARLERIAKSQQPDKGLGAVAPSARGIPDLETDPQAARKEKQAAADNTTKDTPTDSTRGKGK